MALSHIRSSLACCGTTVAVLGALFVPACGGSMPGDASDAGPDAATCARAGGSGTVELRVVGLPSGVAPRVSLADSAGVPYPLTAAGAAMLQSGEYTVRVEPVAGASDPIVRSAYRGTVASRTVRVCGGERATLEVTYAPIETSNKVWTGNANGAAPVLGFASAVLATGGSPPASVAAQTQGAGGVTFDRDGNLWVAGGTVADATLLRYPASALGASGRPTPDVQIDVPTGTCGAGATALAFDAAGGLWLSQGCAGRVARLAPAQLVVSGEVTPAVSIRGLANPQGLAFDASGNLWVATEGLARYDAARLSASIDGAPDATLRVGESSFDAIAFDARGALWAVGGSQTNLARIAAADLDGRGVRAVTPAVQISVGVGALPEGVAFDESGGLWIATSQGRFARLSPAQLEVASTYADPTVPERVIASIDTNYAGSFALYPAPAGLPLYHRLP